MSEIINFADLKKKKTPKPEIADIPRLPFNLEIDVNFSNEAFVINNNLTAEPGAPDPNRDAWILATQAVQNLAWLMFAQLFEDPKLQELSSSLELHVPEVIFQFRQNTMGIRIVDESTCKTIEGAKKVREKVMLQLEKSYAYIKDNEFALYRGDENDQTVR